MTNTPQRLGRPPIIRLKNLLIYVFLTTWVLPTLFAFVWVLSVSLKTNREFMGRPPWTLPENPQFVNYTKAWGKGVGTMFKNSLIIAFFSIVGTLISNTPVAYAFARIKFPGRDLIFILVLATIMLPFQVTMIPLYLMFNDFLHWGDSFLPLIVPAFFANAYDIFLLRQFFRTIPEEMSDAARVDGASEWQIFTQIMLPLSVPVLATITVFTFLWAWNDFTGPLLFLTSPRNFTMALGLQDFQGQHTMVWNQMMAAATVFTLPIVIAFFFAQKTFIQGIKLTGLKE